MKVIIATRIFGPEVSAVGSPGGAAKTGKIAADHPIVAELPPQGEH